MVRSMSFERVSAISTQLYTYLVLAQEWQMQDDFKRLGIGGQNDEIGKASVQSLGGLVGALLQLYHLTKGDQCETQ